MPHWEEVYNEALLSPLQLLHNEYSERGFCASKWLKQSRLSQRTPPKIGAWLFSATQSGRFVFSPLEFSPRVLLLDTLSDGGFNLLWNVSPETQLGSFTERSDVIYPAMFDDVHRLCEERQCHDHDSFISKQTSFRSDTHHDKRIDPTTPSTQRKESSAETQDSRSKIKWKKGFHQELQIGQMAHRHR